MDENGALAASFDKATRKLKVTQVAGPSVTFTHTHDANGVWQAVYDAATNTLRIVTV